jgi:hypothetical protein
MTIFRLPASLALAICWFAAVDLFAGVRAPTLVGLSLAVAKTASTDINPSSNTNRTKNGTTKNIAAPIANTLVRVPNVLVRLPNVAEDMLMANGLRMEARGNVAHGTALCQTPSAETEVKRGSVVIVVFQMPSIRQMGNESCRSVRCRARY